MNIPYAYIDINVCIGVFFMDVKRKIGALMKSLVISYVITGFMLIAIAFALYKLGISENTVNLLIIIVYVFSCFVGGLLVGKMVKEKKFLWGLLLGLVYMTVICAVSFIVNGTISITAISAITTLLLCTGGGTFGGMIS